MKYPEFFKEYKDIHCDKTAFLIGGGPSLKDGKKYFDYAKSKDYLFFGNNDLVFEKILFKLDYFILSDKENLKRRGRYNFINAEAKKEKFYVNYKSRKYNKELLTKDELKKSKGKSFDVYYNNIFRKLEKKSIHRSSLFITFQLILIMGIKKIYLIGCDCGGSNFFINKGSNYTLLIEQWKYLKDFTKKYFPDVKIFIINPVNLKDVFLEDPNYFKP
tara:strand:- start:5626 stop:6276 length:651 start_codon:yes stop_codon:yes gene_type:complete